MKFDFLHGRLGEHRFHSMLVHFPTGLYPFSLTMDLLGWINGNEDFFTAARYALIAAVGSAVPAMIYGALDFLKVDPKSDAWKKAGVHALLNFIWFLVFCILLFYRKQNLAAGTPYLLVMGLSTIGLFYSNYLGADLIISHGIGLGPDNEGKSKD